MRGRNTFPHIVLLVFKSPSHSTKVGRSAFAKCFGRAFKRERKFPMGLDFVVTVIMIKCHHEDTIVYNGATASITRILFLPRDV